MMKFGNASWGFRETPLEKQLEITRGMGLSHLELGIANGPNDLALDISDSETKKVKEMFNKYKISLECCATGNDFTNGSKDDVGKIKRVVDICERLGGKYLRIFAGFSPVKDVIGSRWDIMIECLKEVAEYSKAKGVIAVVETHGGVNVYNDGVKHFHSTTTVADSLLKMIDELPDLYLNYDPANLYAVGVQHPEDIYEKIKDRVCYVHLKDFVKLPSGHLKPSACGESDMDWKTVLKSLEDFDGPVLFEYENTEDVEYGSRKCYEFIKKELKI